MGRRLEVRAFIPHDYVQSFDDTERIVAIRQHAKGYEISLIKLTGYRSYVLCCKKDHLIADWKVLGLLIQINDSYFFNVKPISEDHA